MKREKLLFAIILLFGLKIWIIGATNDNFNQDPEILTGNYWDRGVDTDGDGKFDQLNFDVEVDIPESGGYGLSLMLRPSVIAEDYWNSWVNFWEELNKGVQNVSLTVEHTLFYSLRLNTSYVIENINIYGPNYYDNEFQPYTTRVYNYTEFDRPSALLTGDYWDRGVDTNADGKFNLLLIDVEVNITQSGVYSVNLELEVNLTNEDKRYFWGFVRGYWDKGVHNISVPIDTTQFYSFRVDTSYTVKTVEIRDDFQGFSTEKAVEPYTTQVYSYIEFDTPGALLTGNYWDRGVDTDGDGKFDQLVIDVEVNVTQGGDYSLSLSVRPSTTYTYWGSWGESRGYWEIGIHNVSIIIDISSFYSLRSSTSFKIEYLSIYGDSGLLLENNSPYTTREYSYTEFDTPGALLTGNYWDRGVDTDGDGKYEQLEFIIEINVTKSGEYHLEFYMRSIIPGTFHKQNIDEYWFKGVQNVSVFFDDPFFGEFISAQLNTDFLIENIDIFDENYSLIDRVQSSYTTKVYDYREFDLEYNSVPPQTSTTTTRTFPFPSPSLSLATLLIALIFLITARKYKKKV